MTRKREGLFYDRTFANFGFVCRNGLKLQLMHKLIDLQLQADIQCCDDGPCSSSWCLADISAKPTGKGRKDDGDSMVRWAAGVVNVRSDRVTQDADICILPLTCGTRQLVAGILR